jgi:hypothetical protein
VVVTLSDLLLLIEGKIEEILNTRGRLDLKISFGPEGALLEGSVSFCCDAGVFDLERKGSAEASSVFIVVFGGGAGGS